MNEKKWGLVFLVGTIVALAAIAGSAWLASKELSQPRFGEVTIRTQESERGPEFGVEGQVLLGNKPFPGRNIPKGEGEIGYVHMVDQSGAASSILIGVEGAFSLCCDHVTDRKTITLSIHFAGKEYDRRVYTITAGK